MGEAATDKKTDMPVKKKDWSGGDGLIPGRDALGPIFLMLTTGPFSIIYYHVCAHMEGNFIEFGRMVMERGSLFSVIYEIWPNPWDPETWKMILSFMAFNIFLMRAVPGKTMYGTVTPKGNTPVYNANGFECYVLNVVALLTLAHFEIFNPALVYDKFGNILSSMNVFALAFCTMLLIKGYVAPSSTDSGTTGSLIHDFYWVRITGRVALHVLYFVAGLLSHYVLSFLFCRVWNCILASSAGMSKCSPTVVQE